MWKKLMTTAAAASVALVTVAAPVTASAKDRHGDRGWRGDRGGGHYQNYDRRYNGNGGRYYNGHRHRDNDGDALAAGIVGLALGAVLGAALSSEPEPQYGPPPQAYYPPPQPQPYYGGGGDPYYGQNQGQCFRRELQWDPRSRANVEVTIPYPC